MPEKHPHAADFVALMGSTQQAYVERRIDDYLAAWHPYYCSVLLGSEWSEDKRGLADKIARDMKNFELLQMDFELLRDWYCAENGFGHLAYFTRLRRLSDSRVLIDRRENIIAGLHLGAGKWTLISKIVVRAENYFE